MNRHCSNDKEALSPAHVIGVCKRNPLSNTLQDDAIYTQVVDDRYCENRLRGILYSIVPLHIHSGLPSVSIGADFEPVHRRDVMSVIDLENCSVKHYLSLEDALSENEPVERVSLTDGHALVYARINFAHVGLPEKEGGYDLDIGQGIRVKYWVEE